MAIQTIFALGETKISVSGNGELSGRTQGDGSHLQNLFITLNDNAWEEIEIRESDTDTNFDDSDNSQRLNGDQIFDGAPYTDNMRVEAEFGLRLRDPNDPDGTIYELVAFNINEGGGSSFATVEGLAFLGGIGGFPPIGVPLEVISTQEGPSVPYTSLAAPPCFTYGTMIETAQGEVPVQDLRIDDLVMTRDHGAQPIKWIGRARFPGVLLRQDPRFRPICARAHAFGEGRPKRDLALSPQHRVLIDDWRAMLFFGEAEILVPVCHLLNDARIVPDHSAQDVVYFHLLFERHEVICANGMACESLLARPDANCATSREVLSLFPELVAQPGHEMARPCIPGRTARILHDNTR
ncbi:MAG: Hint domain-containing protein [Pseudomonadota bacterium]